MAIGMFFVIDGGWLRSMFTYNGVLFGFVYGSCVPLFRSNVTSRKYKIFLFASMVIFNPLSVKTLQIFFLMFSTRLGDSRNAPKPSSRYIPA